MPVIPPGGVGIPPQGRGLFGPLQEEAARNGSMPALIINSMVVESGEPAVFSNTRFPATRRNNRRILNFYDLYHNQRDHFDIRVNTAARLSACQWLVRSPTGDVNG